MSGWSSWSTLSSLKDLKDLQSLVSDVATTASQKLKEVESKVDSAFGLPQTEQQQQQQQSSKPSQSTPEQLRSGSSSPALPAALPAAKPPSAAQPVSTLAKQHSLAQQHDALPDAHRQANGVSEHAESLALSPATRDVTHTVLSPSPITDTNVHKSHAGDDLGTNDLTVEPVSEGNDAVAVSVSPSNAVADAAEPADQHQQPDWSDIGLLSPLVQPVNDSAANDVEVPAIDALNDVAADANASEPLAKLDNAQPVDADEPAVEQPETTVTALPVEPLEDNTALKQDVDSTAVHSTSNAPNPIVADEESLAAAEATVATDPLTSLQQRLNAREQQIEQYAMERAQQHQQLQSATEARDKAEQLIQELQLQLKQQKERNQQLDNERKTAQIRQSKDSADSHQQLLRDKDHQIQAILSEGQALMVKQQSLETIVRNLRKEGNTYKSELETSTQRAALLNEKLAALTEQHQHKCDEYAELQRRLTEYQKQQGSVEEYKTKLHALQLQCNEYEQKQQQLNDELSSARSQNNVFEERLQRLTTDDSTRTQREDTLLHNINELQAELQRSNDELQQREQQHAVDTAELRRKLMALESEHQELVAAIPNTTKPLLRQIESLQQTMNAQNEAYESERQDLKQSSHSNTLELSKLRKQYQLTDEAKQQLEGELQSHQVELQSLRQRLEQTDQQLKQVQAELQSKHSLVTKYQSENDDLYKRCDALQQEKADTQAKLTTLQSDKQALEQQLNDAMQQLKHERNDNHNLKRMNSYNSVSQPTGTPSTPYRQQSTATEPHQQRERGDSISSESSATSTMTSPNRHSRNTTETDSWASSLMTSDSKTTVNAVEMLRSMIRQKDHEIHSLRSQLKSSKKLYESVQQEVDQRSKQEDEERRAMQARVQALEQETTKLQQRHDLALQLLGEREDELEDAKQDLQHVKQMFQQQLVTFTSPQKTISASTEQTPRTETKDS